MRRLWILSSVVGFVLAVVPVLGPPPAGAESGDWSIQPSPTPAGTTSAGLFSVSCLSDGTCQAVGNFIGPKGYEPLAESFDGSTWSIESAPAVAKNSYLTGVSCVSDTWCMAVGQSLSAESVDRALTEVWNGSAWSVVPTPLPAGTGGSAGLIDVSCTAETLCLAVGAYAGSGVNSQDKPLAERWNGSAWKLVSSVPNPHAENGSDIEAVSCTTDLHCEAGADYDYADVAQSIYALGYDGTSWISQKQPNPGDNSFDSDNAVSCTSKTDCISVGSLTNIGGNKVLVEAYHGSSWSREKMAAPPGAATSELNGVSCIASESCVAVGDWSTSDNEIPEVPLAESSGGSTWTMGTTPSPEGAELTSLEAVSCVAGGGCTAVGNYYNGTSTQTLVETEDG
jgi:hypothetical protein